MGASADFPTHKAFTERTDRRFFLDAPGHVTLKIGAMEGGVTTRNESYVIITLGPGDWRDLVKGVEYTLRPQNANAEHRWAVEAEMVVVR